jgi:conjugal transfer pilus assembly protein TraF
MNFLIIFIFVLITQSAIASDDRFFEDSDRGWFWYEKEKPEDEEKQKVAIDTQDASAQMKALKAELEKTLDKAILYPTEQNIISYILLQEKIADRSERFADNWQKALYTHPELDRKVKHPTTQAALPIYYQEKSKATKAKIASIAKEYGLLYFYKGGCPYCTAFAPVIRDFAARYNLTVLGITLDGIVLREFPTSRQDNGIATSLNIKVVPALIAVHPKTGKQIPIAYGMISQSEMEARINLLVEGGI